MIFARNNIVVSQDEFREDRTFNLDAGVFARKLSVVVLSEDRQKNFIYGPVIVQTTEDEQHTYENELNTSQFLELGFSSLVFATAISGARFRIPNELEVPTMKPAKLHIVFYG